MHLIVCVTSSSIDRFLSYDIDRVDRVTLYLKSDELNRTQLESIRARVAALECAYHTTDHSIESDQLYLLSSDQSHDNDLQIMDGSGHTIQKDAAYASTMVRVFGLWDSHMSDYIRILFNKAKRTNPSFRTALYDEARFLQTFPKYDSLRNALKKHPICKADVYRYVILYEKGGLYSDMDIDHYASLAPLIDDEAYDVVLFVEFDLLDAKSLGPRENPANLTRIHNCIMWSKPRHPFFGDCIQVAKTRFASLEDDNVQFQREDVLWCTGPDVVTSVWHDKYRADPRVRLVSIKEKSDYFVHMANNSWV
jgi:hypothetical protein